MASEPPVAVHRALQIDATFRSLDHASSDDEVELPGVLRLIGQVGGLAAKRRHRLALVRGREGLIGRQDDGIASTIEAGQIVQSDRDLGLADIDSPAVLPVPLGSGGSEGASDRLAVGVTADSPGSEDTFESLLPDRTPVLGRCQL